MLQLPVLIRVSTRTCGGYAASKKTKWDRLKWGYSAKNTESSQLKTNVSLKGLITGTVLTIMNSDPGIPLTPEEYPLGQLIALSDPSASTPN